ncbi:hypothetical protein [Paenibacillus azoreducens]|uniref:DUF4179 domain-containing protein n=1 Tax=Paenibacillus azoreducens TaxID=116718 RepID=A0A919YG44_9BACL|nr:hypothetical protein [Paenibacillus azoreducens]GIO48075.1 hypothetical protein J34TS1_28400 [Paenibacillus azoreducens]
MFEFNDNKELERELKAAMDQLEAPDTLKAFAKNIAVHTNGGKSKTIRPRKKIITGLAAGCAASLLLIFTAQVSPAFAGFVHSIPGFSVASDWLDSLRGRDGVQNAGDHDYRPFEPVTQKFGNTTLSLADVYLTGDKLMYKAFIQSEDIKRQLIQNPDGSPGFNTRTGKNYIVQNLDVPALSGGLSENIIYDEETHEPILVLSNKMQLNPEEVKAFLNGNPDKLRFAVGVIEAGSNKVANEYKMEVPFDKTRLMKDRIVPVHQPVKLAGRPEFPAVTVEKLKITPVNTYIDLSFDHSDAYDLGFDPADYLERHSITLIDDHGKAYPMEGFKLENDGTGSGQVELAFTSSPYFDKSVRNLQFYMDNVEITDREDESFMLELHEQLPKTIQYKDASFILTDAHYENGLLKIKVKQNPEDRMKLRFSIPSFQAEISQEERGKYDAENADQRKEVLVPEDGKSEYDLSIMAPKQETYRIHVRMEDHKVKVGREFKFDLP